MATPSAVKNVSDYNYIFAICFIGRTDSSRMQRIDGTGDE